MDAIDVKTDGKTGIKKVLIIAGGTGGHVMPALSVAQYLRTQGIAVHWIGTHTGIEASLVTDAYFPISYIDIKGLRGHTWRRWLIAPWQISKAIIQASKIMLNEKPDVVLSMGGYVSGPGAIAAWILRIPFILHEQNAVEGWTNRLLSHFAKRIMVAFPNTFDDKKKKVVYTGNPVRADILNLLPPDVRLSDRHLSPLRILVLGGSLGATALNETVPRAIALFPDTKRPEIWHQTGKNHLAKTEAIYDQCGVKSEITDFIPDMSKAYEWADLIICRSGALTVSEIAAVGIPSILIPFPHAIGDHQTVNARFLSDENAAILLPQPELNDRALHDVLNDLINSPKKRMEMAKLCREFAKPQATAMVALQCMEVGGGA